MARRCPSCDGILGVDCFNADECALITLKQNASKDYQTLANKLMAEELLTTCRAVLEAIKATDLQGAVLWIKPPYQAEAVHETASERLAELIAKYSGEKIEI